jgi:hypothetical protein
MDEKITLTKVNIIGTSYYDVFSVDGEKVEVEISKEEYEALATNSRKPKLDRGEWKVSYITHKYDSDSGKLEEGTYAEDTDCKLILKDGIYLSVKKEDMVGDKIDSALIETQKSNLLARGIIK